MGKLLNQFVKTFAKAISLEMEYMAEHLGSSEIELVFDKTADDFSDNKKFLHRFSSKGALDKLYPSMKCTLKTYDKEFQVFIENVAENSLTVICDQKIARSSFYKLVVYPWFLYEKLKEKIESIEADLSFFPGRGLMLFGKLAPKKTSGNLTSLETDHSNLNPAQKEAVLLTFKSDLSFIWGPPGTGKTVTLGHIVTELIHKKLRVLICSNTNAAVDQVIEKLAEKELMKPFFDNGEILRIGQTSANTFETHIEDIKRRLNSQLRDKTANLRDKRRFLMKNISKIDRLIEKISSNNKMEQLSIFENVTQSSLSSYELSELFGTSYGTKISRLSENEQTLILKRRKSRIETAIVLSSQRLDRLEKELSDETVKIVDRAKVILSTLSNLYVNPLLEKERFDVVIVEEASMAVLPALFYAASLSRDKVIAVGDPRQLPPIVGSKNPFVLKAMARDIFNVTVPNTETSESVQMLNVQHRMHPDISQIVSDLFYSSKLKNGEEAHQRHYITEKSPFENRAVTVIDTCGKTKCVVNSVSYSRKNRETAEIALNLAKEALQNGINSIAIITPYVEQSRLISNSLFDSMLQSRVECSTVHRFQGHEKDLVIIDTVDTEPSRPSKLLSERRTDSTARNLINVSLSRARGKLIIIADIDYFKRNAKGSIISKTIEKAVELGSNLVRF